MAQGRVPFPTLVASCLGRYTFIHVYILTYIQHTTADIPIPPDFATRRLFHPRRLVELSTNPIPTGWFVQKIDRKPTAFQPSFQACALRYEGSNGVGFWKTNRHSNYRPWYTKIGTRLVFAKPTVGFPIWGLEHGRFPLRRGETHVEQSGVRERELQWRSRRSNRDIPNVFHSSLNQPSFELWIFLYDGWRSVGFGLIFCTNQLSTVGPVREGSNTLQAYNRHTYFR